MPCASCRCHASLRLLNAMRRSRSDVMRRSERQDTAVWEFEGVTHRDIIRDSSFLAELIREAQVRPCSVGYRAALDTVPHGIPCRSGPHEGPGPAVVRRTELAAPRESGPIVALRCAPLQSSIGRIARTIPAERTRGSVRVKLVAASALGRGAGLTGLLSQSGRAAADERRRLLLARAAARRTPMGRAPRGACTSAARVESVKLAARPSSARPTHAGGRC
jgi:hypothetical protein